MSLGGGAGDILKALEICKWIWENCLKKSNAADVQYDQFRRDIKNLWRALEDLHDVVDEARTELDPFQDDTKDITGDFLETLKACREFLIKNVDAKRGGFRQIVENVKWGLARKKEADDFRAQLQFHTQTLGLVIAPVNTEILAKMHGDISELIEGHRSSDVRNSTRPESVVVPEWLRGVFRCNLNISQPVPFDSPENIPLRHGCRALNRHFSHLSEGDGTGETRREFVQEYLGLLKCHWLVSILRDGREFQLQPAGTPFRRFISNVDVAVDQKLRSREKSGAVVTNDELVAAREDNEQPFLIWEPLKQRPQREPWEPSDEEGEEKVLTVPLKRDEKLVVIRRGLTTYRLVPIVETADGTRRSSNQDSSEIRLNTDAFVPLYTVAGSGDTLAAEIYQHNNVRPVRYELADRRATWNIQHVITGFQVRDDQNNVTWSIVRKLNALKGHVSPNSRKEEMKGRIQLWQWNPLDPSAGTPPDDTPVNDPSANLSTQSMSTPTVSRISSGSTDSDPKYAPARQPSTARSKTPSVAPSQMSVASTIRRRDTKLPKGKGKHTELHPPICPVVILFGQSGLTHTYFHLEMNRDICVDETRCECTNPRSNCKRIIIRQLDSRAFTVRSLSAGGTSEMAPLKSWNLSLLRGLDHPKEYYNDEGNVKRIASDYLALEFPTCERRVDFSKRLTKYFNEYHRKVMEYDIFIHNRKIDADSPKKPGDNDSGYSGSMYSPSSTSHHSSPIGSFVPLHGIARGFGASSTIS